MQAVAISAPPKCSRCGSKLVYEGRPCPVCYSPAVHELHDGKIREIAGLERPANVRLPKFAQPALLRGKNIRKPRGERAIAVLFDLGNLPRADVWE